MQENIFSLLGKRIVVTGASSGIGKACAKVCASMGAELLLVGRDEPRLKKVLFEISRDGDELHSYEVIDLNQSERLSKIIEDFIL